MSKMTAKVRKMISSRAGNGWPEAVPSGSARAMTSESPPRMAVQPMKVASRQEGAGSLPWRRRFIRSSSAAAKVYTSRTTMAVRATTAP